MHEFMDAITLEEEEDDGVLVYCMTEGGTDVSKKRKHEG